MTDPDAGTEFFHIDVEITDEALVEWLRELPDDQLAARVEDTLRAGHIVLNLVQAAAGEEQMARYFRPVTERMDDLKDTLDEIMERAQKSQRLGEIGEEIVTRQLEASFPGDSFKVVSEQAGEADIEARFDLDPLPETEARVEVKLYSRDVPGPELEKFRRDLKRTGVRYGLMVSLSSRLTGVRGPLFVEDTVDYTAVFLPNAGLDGVRLMAATAMLKAIILYHARSAAARRVPAAAVERAWDRINTEIEQIEKTVRDVDTFRQSIRKAEAVMTRHMNDLADDATLIHANLHTAVRNLTVHLYDELVALPSQERKPALKRPTPADTILAELDRLQNAGDKRAAAFRRLHEAVTRAGHEILIGDDGSWRIVSGGKEQAHAEVTKTRVDVVFPITDATIELDTVVEKQKGDTIVVSGGDIEAMAKRVGERLGGKKNPAKRRKKR
jgi:hypothetical protein